MATEISRPISAAALAITALAAAGCGGAGNGTGISGTGTGTSSRPAPTTAATTRAAAPSAASPGRAFGWLIPGPPPGRWFTVGVASGATMSYPPGWRLIAGDRGTATAALRDQSGRYVGYLNLTPRQGDETLANWRSFRLAHNRLEGERNVRSLAAAKQLRFRSGPGSCVQDAYTTSTGAQFVELACLVRGQRASSVIVGAAPPEAWPRSAAVIERAISALTS